MVHPSAVSAAKQELRRTARRIRAEISKRERRWAAEQLAAYGIDFVAPPAGAVVSGFFPVGDEIDPQPLMLRLAREGFQLALPVMDGKATPLRFRLWTPGDLLEEKAWGIREPLPSAPEVISAVMLVPLLAFDAAGFRLGYGGGFYDRTLAAARSQGKITAIGIAHDVQEVPAVPRLDFEQRLDWVLTPTGPRRCVRD